jgi:hypothetical protein
MLYCVLSHILTNVSDELTAYITRVISKPCTEKVGQMSRFDKVELCQANGGKVNRARESTRKGAQQGHGCTYSEIHGKTKMTLCGITIEKKLI